MVETHPSAIGIIGVGAIAEAIVAGLRAGADEGPSIFLSPRNAQTADALASRYPDVHVCQDNQSVVDSAPVVLLTVRPQVVAQVLGDLRMPAERVVISAVAGWSIEALRARLGGDPAIVRAIPMPAVQQRQGITALYPSHPIAEELFGRLGGTLVAAGPDSFDAFSAATASVSTYLHYLETVANWLARQGIESEAADRYVRSMFLGLQAPLADQAVPLNELGRSHETPSGLNEALRTGWFTPENRATLGAALDGIRQRVASGTFAHPDS